AIYVDYCDCFVCEYFSDSRNLHSFPTRRSSDLFNNGSIQKDDIEKIEIVLGPQTALYGPNAHNALFNFISKDPRKYPGTTVSFRSEEHTSELQSRENIVCRLLLEKKKKKKIIFS